MLYFVKIKAHSQQIHRCVLIVRSIIPNYLLLTSTYINIQQVTLCLDLVLLFGRYCFGNGQGQSMAVAACTCGIID